MTATADGGVRTRAEISEPLRQRSEWPRARLTRLKTLFEAGLSHQSIARRMGLGKGRVSAKIARLGWSRAAPPAVGRPAAGPPLGLRLEQLAEDGCRWPVDEDTRGTMLFCGCAQGHGSPYCPGHQARSRRRPFQWERRAMEPARPPAEPKATGWERFPWST